MGSDYPFPLGEHHPGKLIEDSHLEDQVKVKEDKTEDKVVDQEGITKVAGLKEKDLEEKVNSNKKKKKLKYQQKKYKIKSRLPLLV